MGTVNTEAGGSHAKTRELIPVVALKLFADKGYDATSMREIAEQLNISKAALYYHFDSKEAIVSELVTTMLDQVAELVSWAKKQRSSADLRTEVLTRWSDIMQAHGLAMFRFVIANRNVMHNVRPDHGGMAGQLTDLYALLSPPDASVEEQLRVRMALMSINMAGLAGSDILASDAEILQAARKIAAELLPR
ncbi:MAG: TetR/AcrR family transcriptional regulator [Marmoricola sp.]|nr:TetR/AcrR family transcriptional regulator [Marmoricola sp.]